MTLTTVHRIPCEICYTGNARVSDYFIYKNTEQKVDCNWNLEVSFRGRPWMGQIIHLEKHNLRLAMLKKNVKTIDKECIIMAIDNHQIFQWAWDPDASHDSMNKFTECPHPWNDAISLMHMSSALKSSVIDSLSTT